MAEHPVKNGLGADIITGYDVDANPFVPRDPSGDYPVLDGLGNVLIAAAPELTKTWPTRPDGARVVNRYPVKDGLGNDIITHGTGGGSGPVTYDYYVDSVSGNDANPGTQASPFKTIAQATTALATAGTSLGLVKGSYWREMFTVPRTGFRIGVVGSGAPPVFDGADVITGTWTQPDAANQPNVWSIVVTRALGSATEYIGYWEGGVRPRYATNATTDLQANGGWRASNRTTANPTIYIKAAADPNSDGIVREYTRRAHGIVAHQQVLGGAQRTCTITGPVEATRCLSHYNAFAPSSGPDAQLFAREGHIHHIVTQAALTEDVICAGGDPSYPTEAIPFTMYQAVGAGFNPVAKRIFVEDPGCVTSTGVYSHTSDAGPASVTIEQCAVSGPLTSGVGGVTSIKGHYASGNKTAVLMQPITFSAAHCIVRNPPATGSGFADSGPVDTQNKTRVVENCVIYINAGAANAAFSLASRAGTITIRNCIIVMADTGYFNSGVNATPSGSGLSILFEYNVFVNVGFLNRRAIDANACTVTSDHNMYIGYHPFFQGNSSGLQTTLAAWQATGQDVNSSYNAESGMSNMSAYFQGLFSAGDFRLKAGLGTFADGVSKNLCGPQSHWDWNQRKAVAGAPEKWPVLPANLAEQRSYISDPVAWNFYP